MTLRTDNQSTDEPPNDHASRRFHYGWLILLTDAISVSALLAGFSHSMTALGIAGGVGLFLAAPLVHCIVDGFRKGFLSFAVRFGGTILGFVGGIIYAIVNGPSDPPVPFELVVVAVWTGIGLLVSMIFDWLRLGRRTTDT